VLRLAIEGRLDLNTPVSHYLPNGYKHFHKPFLRSANDAHDLVSTDVLRRISVAQLLNHSSGFPNWSSARLALEFEPGARWGYSGEGFAVLQAILETLTNIDLATYLEQRVFQVLGMSDSSLIWRDSFTERAVKGSTLFGLAHFRSPVAAASLYTTATDYANFMSAVLADQQILSLIKSTQVEVESKLGLAWG